VKGFFSVTFLLCEHFYKDAAPFSFLLVLANIPAKVPKIVIPTGAVKWRNLSSICRASHADFHLSLGQLSIS
jgi:hypothetical protein